MKNFYETMPLLPQILKANFFILFLDYDGTLTPIVGRPEDAYLPSKTRDLLVDLASNPFCKLVVISGRSITDVKSLVNIKGIGYVGNHGLEVEVPGMSFNHFDLTASRNVLSFVKKEVQKMLGLLTGAIIEDKGCVMSIHYRQVNHVSEDAVRNLIENIVKPYILKGELILEYGKKVIELKPPLKWNKGHAVSWIIDEYCKILNDSPIAVMIGDDKTDEDAFSVLKEPHMTIKVGQEESKAMYFVKSSEDVTSILAEFAKLKINK